jgi:phospholipid/cholesterol/gamma-HCH transport system substrate-binding protein
MNRSGLEWKVGLFVLLSLGFAAALIMKFSKSSSVFTKTYEILVITSNAGGMRPGASVLMAGVQIGTVEAISLDDNGKIVTMYLQIQSRYRVHADALFTIEQAGFLGDEYIAITPQKNKAPEIQPDQTVRCREPFNLQEVARSASGLLQRIDQTALQLNDAVSRIDHTILAESTLTNFAAAVVNFRVVSERALAALHNVDDLVSTNSPALTVTVSNLVHFSEQLDDLTEELQLTVATNRVEITSAMQNLQLSTVHLNGILNDLQAGKGLAGGILKDEDLRQQFASTLHNLNVVSSNLSVHGLLWRPPRPRQISTNTPVYTGKMPSR